MRAELDFHQKELGGRGEFVATVLAALSSTVGPEVRIESVAEASWFELEIGAWALSQAAGYRFARDLTDALEKWHLAAGDVDIREQPGGGGVPGYSVKLTLSREPGLTAAPAEPVTVLTGSAP